jgi:hypothetical protein
MVASKHDEPDPDKVRLVQRLLAMEAIRHTAACTTFVDCPCPTCSVMAAVEASVGTVYCAGVAAAEGSDAMLREIVDALTAIQKKYPPP